MEILVKQISQEVESVKGWIVYVMDVTGRPLTAKICELDNLVPTITKLESVFNI
jgi:hypothetical protein